MQIILMYKAALFLNILLLFRRQARFASIAAQRKCSSQSKIRPDWNEKKFYTDCASLSHMSTMATRHWQSWKKRRWSSSLTTPSAASSPIWTPSGYGSASARCCSVRRWRSQITARRSTRICGSSASPTFKGSLRLYALLSAGQSRRCRAVHRRNNRAKP